MPVVIQPAGHKSHVIRNEYTAKDSLDHLNNACRKESAQCRELLQSSFDLEPQVGLLETISSYTYARGAT